MLIKCLECQRDVSDSATACPGCGHPLGLARNAAPSMAESFIIGGIGGLLRLVGFLMLALSIVAFVTHGDAAPILLIAGMTLIVGGSYAKYVSRHSVRTTR